MTTQDRQTLVEMRSITKSFGSLVANRRVTIEIRAGEVLGLLGENGAGKSTLMKILFGLYSADSGAIVVGDSEVRIGDPREALSLGIGMVHQHFMLVPDMTVAENVALGLKAGIVASSGVNEVATELRELAQRYGLAVDPAARIDSLSVGEKQRVEILKALHRGAQVLILDEPTAVLTPEEWHHLRDVLHVLTGEGKAVVLITHKLNEICESADRCIVLRDGEVVEEVGADRMSKQELARAMVGRDVDLRIPRPPSSPGEVALSVDGVSYTHPDGRSGLDELSFTLRCGEVMGIAGVDGNGQRELVDILTGLLQPSSGTFRMAGITARHWTPVDFSGAGGAVVPEERERTAMVPKLTLAENLVLRRIGEPQFSRRGILRLKAIKAFAVEMMCKFDIRAASSSIEIRRMSGGNQQKAVLARELERGPTVLIISQPTRGLDIGAMEFVYGLINEHKKSGGATLLISAELDEVMTLADRIAVMFEGTITGTLENSEATVEEIGLLMTGRTR